MLGKKYYSDNHFTIEFWFYPQIISDLEIPLVGDSTQDVGVFYQKGNILFKLNTTSLEYTLPSTNKSFHIVAVYSVTGASIYVDGQLVKVKPLSNFQFTNDNLNLVTGPTPSPNDSFLINSVAIYRYSLDESRIQYHFDQAQALPAIQVVEPNGGELFELYDDEMSSYYKFTYPESKPLSDLITTGLTYNQSLACLEIIETETAQASTVVVEDFIGVTTPEIFDSSKIEWEGENGISVSASVDGITYSPCVNGQQIPGYTLNSFATTGQLYLRITFSSTDTSRYIPRLKKLSVLFYDNQTKYSYNGDGYIKTLEGQSGVSNYNISLGKMPYEVLSRNSRNGLRTVTDSGFRLFTNKSVRTLEFFYTPSSLTDSGLISTAAVGDYAASALYWHNSGTISKTNISGIYVNGINKTAETNVEDIFKPNQLHHVVVTFISPVSDAIKFNQSLYGSVSALYQYIAIYEEQFSQSQVSENFDLYVRRGFVAIQDSSSITMTEDGVEAYDIDWVVIQNA